MDPIDPWKRPTSPMPLRVILLWAGFLFGTTGLALLIDGPVYQLVHGNYNHLTRPVPDHLKFTTRILRSMEDWGENVFITAIAVVIWLMDKSRRSVVLAIYLSAILSAGSVELLKRSVGRERPDKTEGVTVLHGPAWWFEGGDVQSFPSGHATSAASYSATLAWAYPPTRPVMIALAIGCAGNRIWKERHFLSDCVAGVLIGYFVGSWLPRSNLFRRIAQRFDARFSVPTVDFHREWKQEGVRAA